MARRNNTTQAQCDRGFEFLRPTDDTKTVTKGFTTLAEAVECPSCKRTFPLLPTRQDGCIFLPTHNTLGADKPKPKEPTAVVTAA
jgi:Recombination endonuclease VII